MSVAFGLSCYGLCPVKDHIGRVKRPQMVFFEGIPAMGHRVGREVARAVVERSRLLFSLYHVNYMHNA